MAILCLLKLRIYKLIKYLVRISSIEVNTCNCKLKVEYAYYYLFKCLV